MLGPQTARPPPCRGDERGSAGHVHHHQSMQFCYILQIEIIVDSFVESVLIRSFLD